MVDKISKKMRLWAMSAKKRAAVMRSEEIDKNLKMEKRMADKDIKLLLIGDEVKKNKIMEKIHMLVIRRFTIQELKQYRPLIYRNTIENFATILRIMNNLGIGFHSNERDSDAKLVFDAIQGPEITEPIPKELLESMKRLWRDVGVQECFQNSNQCPLKDSVKYFLDDLDRLGWEDYVPNDQDVYRIRVKTSGIVNFSFKNLNFQLCGTGRLCSKSKKWLHCFDDVTDIIFCVDMSEYDQVLAKDGTKNKMQESLQLFDSICNLWFEHTSVVLLLMRDHHFEEKLPKTPLTICFPDYTGSQEYWEVAGYIQDQFEAKNKSTTKEIYSHIVCVTNMNNILELIFDSATDTVIANNLRRSKLY